jgi:amino acid adenylation domain-containing protein
MSKSHKLSCFLMGSQDRLIRCAEILLQKGHEILGVISDDPVVLKWGKQKALALIMPNDDFLAVLKKQPFDLFCSIINFWTVPKEVLTLPQKYAVNFHDGPLPRYAGVNATNWAIMNGETIHAITWHVMTDEINAGDILKQKTVPISEDETAISLHAKCYEKSIEAFAELIDEIAEDRVKPVQQDLRNRTYFGRWKRPPAGCVVDWSRTAEEIDALSRGLGFGPYPNPLGLPKLFLGKKVIVAKEIHLLESRPNEKPGTITRLTDHTVQVATATREVAIGELTSWNDERISPSDFLEALGFGVGDTLPKLEPGDADKITKVNSKLCRHEDFWVERLASLEPIELPYARQHTLRREGRKRLEARVTTPNQAFAKWKGSEKPGDFLLTALAIYLYRIGGKGSFDIDFRDEWLRQQLSGTEAFFASHVLLRIDADGEKNFTDLHEKIQHQLNRLRERGGSYARDLPLRQPSLREDLRHSSGHGLPVTVERVQSLTDYAPNCDAPLMVFIPDDGKECLWLYDEEVLNGTAIDRMREQFTILLKDIAVGQDRAVAELSILPEHERRMLIEEWNNTQADYPQHLCTHQLFEAQAERTPNALAVICRDSALTYCELNRKANQLASYLQKLGVGSDALVGIYVERSIEMAIGLLGILKAGGAYVPLDPYFPRDRLDFMLEDSGALILLTQSDLSKNLSEYKGKIVCIDSDWERVAKESKENPVCVVRPENLAYVIYTSGSTGKPKGVQIAHRALVNFLFSMRREPGLSCEDTLLSVTTISFDIFGLELFLPLITGAKVVLATRDEAVDGKHLIELLRKSRTSVMQATPATWRLLLEAGWEGNHSLKVLCGGEAFPQDLVAPLLDRGTELWNLYGPTETTIWSTVYQIRSKEEPILIGHPIANTQIYILDRALQPVPVGVIGELYIGGDGVARGYLNRPELTAEKFVPHPFHENPKERIYNTGDLARYRLDGTIECLGRIDHQVKVRGYRIELGEVENLLRQHKAVREAVVLTREDIPGDKRLIAYMVPNQNQKLTGSELRDYLKGKLPDYMVPSHFVTLDAFPLTPNRKIDRKALPAPDQVQMESEIAYVPPKNEFERTIVKFWQEVLNLPKIGMNDNFFELGGHSLLAATIISRLREGFHVELPLTSLLKTPTVTGLASEIARRVNEQKGDRYSAPELPKIVPAPEERYLPFPLTDVQQAYWIGRTDTFELGNVSCHDYAEFESVDLDLERFNVALQRLIERHDMLRAVFLPQGQQQILEHVPSYKITTLDLRGQDPQIVAAQLKAVRQHLSHQVLPSDQCPLFEIRASRLDDRRIRLHISFDVLIGDGLSMQILLRELYQLYQNPEAALAPIEPTFRDYIFAEAAIRDSELYRKSKDYWWSRLLTLPPAPELPLGKRPSLVTHPRFVPHDAKLEPESWSRLKNRGARAGLTPSGILLAAFAEVLKVWSKSPRFTINLTLFNRLPLHPQVNEIVGDFTSLNMLGVENSPQETFEARAQRLQQQLWDDLDHRYVTGVQVLRELAKRKDKPTSAVMPIVFTSILTQDTQSSDQELMAWLGDVVYVITQTPQVWLDHIVLEKAGALVFTWNAVGELFPEGLLQAMFDSYCRFLDCLANDEESWQETWTETVQRLVPPAQLEQRASINTTEAPVKSDLLHTLFAKQVPQRLDQPAVVSSNRTLTYEELFRRSNQVGRLLRQLGVRPNTLVAVVMEKGWEQVVAVVGILNSGAAYLPIDAGLPKERLWYLLKHGEVQFVLTQTGINQTLEWPDGLRRICVDSEEITSVDDRPLDPVQGQEDLAYVIYTSGSTGLPKGVMIDHRGAVNTILDINDRFGVDSNDRVLALSSLSFDLSVYDIFGILAAGGTIIMPDRTETRDPSRWAQLIVKEKVTIWNSVPALMELLVEYVAGRRDPSASSLRLVMMSGDWIPLDLPDQIRGQLGEMKVISLGGATEASIWSILYPIGQVDPAWKSIPYGKPMVNQRFYVLNEALVSCPTWVPGQLYIGGVGLAKGYWRDEEKTQASFITHPRTGERLYRTGDLGRYLPDGNIEFLGREDFQVQIQGYRVELGEIEAALSQHPGVRTVVVMAVGELQGNKHLVAYLVPDQKSPPTPSQLHQFLQQKLPEYMIPSAFVMLEQLPLTPNGKVDRKALPEPSQLRSASFQYPPIEETNLTERIGQFVASILKIDSIPPEANLLHLGATSIHMIRIANLLEKELNFRPKMDEFYRLPSVSGLASAYKHHLQQGEVSKKALEQFLEPTPESVLAVFKLLLDPEDRESFKNKEPGLRKRDDGKPYVELNTAKVDDTLKKIYGERRSFRRFSSNSIPIAQFSKLLSCLRQIRLDGKAKFRYASAGGLYPVQTYLYIKPGRVETLGAGIYYYHPADHGLMLLTENGHIDPDVYDFIVNKPIFDEAAFSIFLIAQLSAIAPMYGDRSMHYATIEAGLMAQLLETSAPACGIGLCQIGDLDFKRIRDLFALDQSHVLVHSLLGGLIDTRLSDRLLSFREVDFGAVGGDGNWEKGEL